MSTRFEPKTPVNLAPPKSDPITLTELRKANGNDSNLCYVAIKGKVFDVSGNKAYLPGGPYHNFAGHDASRALALTSTKIEDVRHEWEDLGEKEKEVLNDWMTYFSKRYNVVGVIQKSDSEA
ncbi:putative steroid-binding protein 3 [Erysiphe necator]|uniref:Putative progesterone binding protein n=1 Tax=Uncinula necator TaxID=52586 RepID=A0A0B1P3I7_UNCNE|nr:putative steroid-binding protein 3 [Erysiphe necator]KHJ31895.1 putative progesterone binding protein [Erysiphe necator]